MLHYTQLRQELGSLYNYRCLVRILDTYGTDPEFNHPYFNPHKDKTRSWGGLFNVHIKLETLF